MLTLNDVLETSVSAEAFLAKRREQFKDSCEKYRAEVLKKAELNPSWRDDVIRDAEDACRNMQSLPGTGGLFFVGDPPAWHECRVPNPEYLWVLNRHYPFPVLGDAYILTGDPKYAKKAVADLSDWLENCPPPALENLDDRTYINNAFCAGTINPWRQFESGVRMGETWMPMYKALLQTDFMTPELNARIAVSVYQHAEILAVVSPLIYSDPGHNHYFVDMNGLLHTAVLFPELRGTKARLDQAVATVEACMRAQTTAEGAQIEASPHYHNLCLDLMQRALTLGDADTFPESVKEIYRLAVGYTTWCIKPEGHIAAIGDTFYSDSGTQNAAEIHYKAFSEVGPFLPVYAILPHPHVGVMPEEVYEKAVCDAEALPGGIRHFNTVGQVIARTGWKRDDSYFIFSCRTPVYNAHAHVDPCTFELVLGGKAVISDPGVFTYAECEERRLFKSAAYHNCLTFGGKEPFEYVNTWAYGAQKPGHTLGVFEGDGFMGADAWHENYAPNEHRRLVVLIGSDTFLIIDDVKNVTGEVVRISFNMETNDYILTDFGAQNKDFRVITPENGKTVIEPMRRSYQGDMWSPTSGVTVYDKSGTDALYATVVTSDPTVTRAHAEKREDGVRITLEKGERPLTFLWDFGKSLSLS